MTNEEMKAEAILALTAAGFALFPLSARTKIPPKDFAWREVPVGRYGPADLAPANYGVILGSSDLVIDVDPRNFAAVLPDGSFIKRELAPEGTPIDNPVKRLIALIGPLNTFRVRTGGDGLHLYLCIPDGMAVIGKHKDFPGLDFKHAGGYVLGPGSIHPDTGKYYVVAAGVPSEVMDAPKALLALIERKEVAFESEGTGEYKDDEGTRALFTAYLKETAQPSVQGQGGDANAFKVACRGRDLALPPQTTLELMLRHWNEKCLPPWEDFDLQGRVIHAYKYAAGSVGNAHPAAAFKNIKVEAVAATVVPQEAASVLPLVPDSAIDWATDKNGKVTSCYRNLLNVLRSAEFGMKGMLGYNEFSEQVEFVTSAPWHEAGVPKANPAISDNDLILMRSYLVSRYRFDQSTAEIAQAAVAIAKDNRFHPIRDYLKGLTWDGTPRIDMWLTDYLGVADTPYSRAVGRKTLCAAVRRVFVPGCKYDQVLMLEGAQGVGKSSVCQILAGAEYCGDAPIDPHDKDTIQNLQGKWILEIAELAFKGNTETEALKAFLTRRSDKARFAYGRLSYEYPRQNIFIATHNPGADNSSLKDNTGNRRWWPVVCKPKNGRMDFKQFAKDRNQLWAEAYQVAMVGKEKLYMHTPELERAQEAEVALRVAEPPWSATIGAWLSGQDGGKRDFVTASEIFISAMGGSARQLDYKATRSIANALKDLGWHVEVRGGVRGFAPGAEAKQLVYAKPVEAALDDVEVDESALEREHALGGLF